MRILLLSTHDRQGGGAVACYRLLQALRSAGADARMLVLHKQSQDEQVQAVAQSWWGGKLAGVRKWGEVVGYYTQLANKQDAFRYASAQYGVDVSHHPWVQWAEVLHVHWVWQGYQSIDSLRKLYALPQAVVHTLHDMWLFTGGCYHSGSCTRYTDSCGRCPLFGAGDEADATRKLWSQKQALFAQRRPAIITPSAWLGGLAAASSLLRQATIEVLPNTLDVGHYAPQPMQRARAICGLPAEGPLLLFGAANASNPYKGIAQLRAALAALQYQEAPQPQVVVFGAAKAPLELPAGYVVHAVGSVTDSSKMAALYAACDVYVHPSLEENLPNTIMESMSCGTPVVAFATGGIPEMLHTGQQGVVVPLGDSEAMAAAIAHLLRDVPARKYMAEGARQYVLAHYTPAQVAQQHLAVYQALLDERRVMK